MKYFSYFFWFIFLLLVVIFSSANSQMVSLNYYQATVHVILPVLLVIMVFLGFLVSLISFIPAWFGVKTRNRKLQQKVAQLETELHRLRSLPMEDIV